MIDTIIHIKHRTRAANLEGDLRGSFIDEKSKLAFIKALQNKEIQLYIEEITVSQKSNFEVEVLNGWFNITKPK